MLIMNDVAIFFISLMDPIQDLINVITSTVIYILGYLLYLLNSTVDLLKGISDVIWSGLIAGSVALGGVFLSNKHNSGQLKIQLEHSSKENQRDRVGALRHEVYLLAAEELSKANQSLATLPQKNPSEENISEGINGFLSSLTKLQLVAEPNTALLAQELSASYNNLMMKLLKDLIPLYSAKNKMKIHKELYSQEQSRIYEIIEKMQPFITQNKIAHADFAFLQSALKSANDELNKQDSLAIQFEQEFNKLNIEFGKNLLQELKSISINELLPMLIAIRKDLGLPTDEESYKQQFNDQLQRTEESLNELIKSITPESAI